MDGVAICLHTKGEMIVLNILTVEKTKVVKFMNEEEFRYCHKDEHTDEYHDCLDYMECEECPYYYADED